VSFLLIVPFVLILLAIALLPLLVPHWWESNSNKALVALILGVPVAGYLLLQGEAGWHRLQHTMLEYVEFMVLLGSLYTISGGIALRGDLQATPVVNGCFLGLGALLASIMGTTGASMLLIRPLLQTNAERRYVAHTIVFFIFLVSNIGGCLTPLGDPPLFLGYLRGVPFTWTLSLWPVWLTMVVMLLAVYGVWIPSCMPARAHRRCSSIARTWSRCGSRAALIFCSWLWLLRLSRSYLHHGGCSSCWQRRAVRYSLARPLHGTRTNLPMRQSAKWPSYFWASF